MKAKRICEEEISELKISSLPTRPTAPSSLGGRGFNSRQMKEAFDRLPLLLVERFNLLIEDIEAEGEGCLADAIKTGFYDGHSLNDLFDDFKNGKILTHLQTSEGSLESQLAQIKARLTALEGGGVENE